MSTMYTYRSLLLFKRAETLSLSVGVSSERSLGLKRMIAWPMSADTDRLGFQLTPLAIAEVRSDEAPERSSLMGTLSC